MSIKRYAIFLFASFTILACNKHSGLPILSKEVNADGETIYKAVPDFRFINQDSVEVTNRTFANTAYVADFFFTSCPTICPIMAQNMLTLYHDFDGTAKLAFLSHTIDPARDTVGRLKHYANNLGVMDNRWHFVTGTKDSLYAIADDYFNVVVEDPTLPDGFDHSGRFVLVDTQGFIRAYCNGTNEAEVLEFKKDIETLLHEMEESATDH
ncbi:MAG: SCO family protein [Phaeodactylibacter sp.]|nr:SCO family protein [Phaeodactylibacter sp.]